MIKEIKRNLSTEIHIVPQCGILLDDGILIMEQEVGLYGKMGGHLKVQKTSQRQAGPHARLHFFRTGSNQSGHIGFRLDSTRNRKLCLSVVGTSRSNRQDDAGHHDKQGEDNAPVRHSFLFFHHSDNKITNIINMLQPTLPLASTKSDFQNSWRKGIVTEANRRDRQSPLL